MEITNTSSSALETRLRRAERKLLVFQIGACGVAALVGAAVLSDYAQAQNGTVKGPLTIVNAKGQTVLTLGEWTRPGSPNISGSTVTLFANGQPAASLVATGDMYKRASDPSAKYLNEMKTYLYEYFPGKAPVAHEVSSLALTEAGGSLIIMGRTAASGGQEKPVHAARITAAKDVGGMLILSSPSGEPGRSLRP
jgi:hypothetical protein